MPSEVPAGWRRDKLGTYIHSLTAGVSVNSESRIRRTGEVGILKTSCLADGVFVPDEHKTIVSDEVQRASVTPLADSIIVSRMNTIDLVGASAYVQETHADLFLPDRLWRLDLREPRQLDARWLAYVLMSGATKDEIRVRASGTSGSMKNLSKPSFLGLPLAVPPLPEQKKIAAILSSVDEAIQATQAVIEQTRRVKEGLLQDLLTRGIGHTRFKQTEIGEIPESWEVVNVDSVADSDRQTILTGPFGASLSKDDFVESGVPVLRIGNVRWGHLQTDDLLHVKEEKARELDKYRVRRGDLLFARQGATTGRNAMATATVEGWLINYHIIRVAVDHSLCLPEYLAYYFNSPVLQRQVDGEKGRGTREGVNSATIRGFRFALPPVDQQRTICDALTATDQEVYKSQTSAQALRRVKSGLLQDLLTGKVRVSV